MKFIFPCIAARMTSLAPSGICISDFVAPAKGGTSDHKLLTVPAFLSPLRVSASRHESATATMRSRARMEVDIFMLGSIKGFGFGRAGIIDQENCGFRPRRADQ